MRVDELEAIKRRVEAGTAPGGMMRAGLAGSQWQATAADDARALLAEIERLRRQRDGLMEAGNRVLLEAVERYDARSLSEPEERLREVIRTAADELRDGHV